ncbi:MAG: MFS transporter [Candidatus Zixiibacteriota bacterium]
MAPFSFQKIKEFLGLKQSIVALLGMVVLVGMGEKMAERFLPIYIIALGGSAIYVGLLNGLDNFLSALYSFPGGYISDRYGTKRALLIFNLIAIAGFVLVIMIPSVWAVIIGSFFFLSWTAVSLPATMSLVARLLPRSKRTMGVSMHSLIRRIPMALGPLAGGLFISQWGEVDGVRLAFVAALVMAIVAVILQQTMIPRDDAAGAGGLGKTLHKNPYKLLRQFSPELKRLLVSDILIRFCEQIPYAFVVLWCMKEIASPVSAFEFGILTTIEMATAVLVYIPVAYYSDKAEKKPFVVMTFVFFTLFPLVLLFSQTFWILVAAFVLRGLKEFGEPTRKALIIDLAVSGSEAATFGTYYLFRDSVVAVAAFGGSFLWLISPATNFTAAFACGAIGTIWFALSKQGRRGRNDFQSTN